MAILTSIRWTPDLNIALFACAEREGRLPPTREADGLKLHNLFCQGEQLLNALKWLSSKGAVQCCHKDELAFVGPLLCKLWQVCAQRSRESQGRQYQRLSGGAVRSLNR